MSREPKPIFCYIEGVPVYDGEQQVLVLCILGLKMGQMMPFLGLTLDQIKTIKKALFERFNVGNVLQLNRKAQCYGFDVYACYRGVPVFTPREQALLLKRHPWVGPLSAPVA